MCIKVGTVYTRILAERNTQNINAEIVGSAYTCITIITLLHLCKITILTLILRGRPICEVPNVRVYTVDVILTYQMVVEIDHMVVVYYLWELHLFHS